MKNYFLLVIPFLWSSLAFSQVGVETQNPKGIFHVDGNKDNPKNDTDPISPAQQANDVVVLQNSGRVGIGTISPTTNLEINNGTTSGAIKITDGNQGSGKYLISDNNGLATWVKPNSFKSTVVWTYSGTPQTVSITGTTDSNGMYNSGSRVYSNLLLTELTTGRWIVNIGLRLATSAPLSRAFWIHANLSSSIVPDGTITSDGTAHIIRSTTGFTNLGPAGNSTGYASVIYGDGTVANGKGFLTGTTIINVTSATPINLYLLLEDTGQWSFDTSSPENFFFATPVN